MSRGVGRGDEVIYREINQSQKEKQVKRRRRKADLYSWSEKKKNVDNRGREED